MDYIEKAKKRIREEWFKNHSIQSIKGEEGFQEIIFGEANTYAYQVKYTLTGNMVFVSGDLGIAAFELTELARIERLENYDLTYFTRKWVGGNREKYEFDGQLAAEHIKEYFMDWCNIDRISELNEDDRNLYYSLIEETKQWSLPNHFSTAVYHIYQSTNLEWFESEEASCIANCGQQLSYSLISYWVGIQMIAKLLNEKAS